MGTRDLASLAALITLGMSPAYQDSPFDELAEYAVQLGDLLCAELRRTDAAHLRQAMEAHKNEE